MNHFDISFACSIFSKSWEVTNYGFLGVAHLPVSQLMRGKIDLGIAQSPASYVESLGNVVTVDHFSSMSLVERLQQEFFAQGDKEKEAGLVISPLCDRTKPGITSSQVDFIEFVAIKQFELLANAFPDTSPLLAGLAKNHAKWKAANKLKE